MTGYGMVYDENFPKCPPPRRTVPAARQASPKQPPTVSQTTPSEKEDAREQREYVAACALELAQRKRWRADPVLWCRERVNLEPSWKILAAQSLNMSLADFEKVHGGELEDKMIQVLESVRDNPKTLVKSGHQVGKTIIAAAVVLWWLDVYRPSRAVTTSASWPDVETKLWGHIRSLYRKNGQWFGMDVLETALKISDEHYALGLSPKEVEPFQGHNSPHTLVAFDEASSIHQKFFDAADAEAHRMLALGNPLTTDGAFYRYSKSSEWRTISISCLVHPNVVYKSEIIPGGPRYEWVQSRAKAWNAPNGPLWLSRVAGEFPEESEDTLFPLSVIRKCFELYQKVKDLPTAPEGRRVLGLDVARSGGDKTIGYDCDWVRYEGRLVHRAKIAFQRTKTEHHATRMIVQGLHRTKPYDEANVDAGGEGSGLADELQAARREDKSNAPITNRILFGAKPSDDDYFDCRAEMYWQLSRSMKGDDFAVEEDSEQELEEELSVIGGMRSLKPKMVKHKKVDVFWLPPKEEAKELLGRSPDKSDGLALGNYKGKTCGLFEQWKNEATGKGAAPSENPSPSGPVVQELGDTTPGKERQKVWRERVVEVELTRSLDRKPKPPVVIEPPRCPDCGGTVAIYADVMICDACGKRVSTRVQ